MHHKSHLVSRAVSQVTWKWIMVLMDDEHGVTGTSVLQHELIHLGIRHGKRVQQENLSSAQQRCNLRKADLYPGDIRLQKTIAAISH